MATFENVVIITRPIEDVFALLSDLENIPRWNYAIIETRKVSEGPIGVVATYHQVRSVPSREERLQITTYNLPVSWRSEVSSGRSRPACWMPWTPPQSEPGSPPRWSSSYAVLAAYWGASPCPVSGTPWPPTLGGSRNCWRGSVSGHLGHKPAVSTGYQPVAPARE